MSYLIDSDVLADYLQGRSYAVQLISLLADQKPALSVITYGEIYEGIYYAHDPQAAERLFIQFLRGVNVLPVTKSIMKYFARVRGELRRNGNLIGDTDILIAATAIHHDLILVTRNLRHFQRIPGLLLQNP